MKQFDVAILTDSRYENPKIIDQYNEQILLEDQLVQKALEAKGVSVIRVDWARQGFDWSSVKFAIFRSTWDYSERFDEFSRWCQMVKDQTQLINSFDQITWNMDKHYLKELAAKGINIPESVFVEPNQKTTLSALHAAHGWSHTVLKPAISAGGRHTYKLDKNNLADYESIFQELVLEESMLLQPFLDSIPTMGERSLMVLNGKFTHAVLKKVKEGDFRVQDDFGGSVEPYEPSTDEIEFAEKVIMACDVSPIYARVDLVFDNKGNLALSELELIEPEMWFRFNPAAANELAKGILNLMNYTNLRI
jgi:glutathione synthase/RimK-type ligase-like ATP-grasp enzyme